ncbi:MAG: lysine--tRNA ligase [Candidatus Nealsonbacteria bacterium]
MPILSIQKSRLKKLEAIKKAGINPYPTKSAKTHAIKDALADFTKLVDGKTKVVLCGRIRSIREHGGLTFFNFEDETGSLQALLNREKIGEKQYQFFADSFDIGDFIEVSGILFITKRGEKTVEAEDFKILAKSLLPLPEKWHGLQDVEERFRKRYLDLIMNPEVKMKFITRSKILKELRKILWDNDFLEVETPILQPIPGGALAKPFKTHLNALKMDLYLRIAPELYLKRLLVGGFEKIYEIGRCFRNEGMDAYHNPDFTMIELYWAYQDRDGLMDFVEKTMVELVKKIKGGVQFDYQQNKIDFTSPWARISFRDLILKYTGIDIEKTSDAVLLKKIIDLKIKIEKSVDRCKLLDELYKETCRSQLIQPTFIVDHPVEMAVLAKAKEQDPRYANRFQLVVGGIEMVNAFSELNDPQEQKKRFLVQKIATERKDKDFLEALEYGMPPAAGLGIGIDRLIILLTDCHSLREAILFPIMRQK